MTCRKQAGRKAREEKKANKPKRADKGRPRWTAYLIWSCRRRKEIQAENEDFTFAQVSKQVHPHQCRLLIFRYSGDLNSKLLFDGPK